MDVINEEGSWKGKGGKKTKLLPLLSSIEVDFICSAEPWTACLPIPVHQPTIPLCSPPPPSCYLSPSTSLEFSFPALLEPGSLRKSFCTWPTPPGILRLLSIMLNQPESALSTGGLRHIIWSHLDKKKISSKMLDLFGLFLKAQVVPCLHESFIQGLYKQTQERQQCFKQLLWTK